MPTNTLEYWLRGPVKDVPPLLQPVAHALLQAGDEVARALIDFDDQLLWTKPAGQASVGFHLQHLTGVLNRLFTYAKGQQLSPLQLEVFASEGFVTTITSRQLVEKFYLQVEQSIQFLATVDANTLGEKRLVGRAELLSTVLGLLFHAAEHTMRHTGQLLVTAKWVSQ